MSDEELVEHINELVKENQTPADCPADDDDEKTNLTDDALGQVSLPEKRISSLLIQISLVQMLNRRMFQAKLASSLTLVFTDYPVFNVRFTSHLIQGEGGHLQSVRAL